MAVYPGRGKKGEQFVERKRKMIMSSIRISQLDACILGGMISYSLDGLVRESRRLVPPRREICPQCSTSPAIDMASPLVSLVLNKLCFFP